MPNEITIAVNISADKGGAKVSLSSSKRITMTGDDMGQATQVIGTTAELLDLGDVAGAPRLGIKNLDTTNFIEIGGDSGLTVFKLVIKPGETSCFMPSSGTVYAKADTADCRIQFVAIEQ